MFYSSCAGADMESMKRSDWHEKEVVIIHNVAMANAAVLASSRQIRQLLR